MMPIRFIFLMWCAVNESLPLPGATLANCPIRCQCLIRAPRRKRGENIAAN